MVMFYVCRANNYPTYNIYIKKNLNCELLTLVLFYNKGFSTISINALLFSTVGEMHF